MRVLHEIPNYARDEPSSELREAKTTLLYMAVKIFIHIHFISSRFFNAVQYSKYSYEL